MKSLNLGWVVTSAVMMLSGELIVSVFINPTVQHLAVHLENDQRVYFTEKNAEERTEQLQNTTLKVF